jgi:hypothetical protein
MDFGNFFVEVCAFFRFFLFKIILSGDWLGPQKGFLFFFPVVFELEPLKFVGKEGFHELKEGDMSILILNIWLLS